MRKPDFLCIGSQKAGTTWLDRNLRQHPQVWIPIIKEIHYFDDLFVMEGKLAKIQREKILKKFSEQLNDKINNVNSKISYNYLRGLAKFVLVEKPDDNWYFSLFEDTPSNCITGEITPAYSALPEEGVKYMFNLLPNAKIIHIIRNPIKRAWSSVLMAKRKEIQENKTIDIIEWRKAIRAPINVRLSDQKTTVELYSNYFPQEQILYLFYDEICASPFKVMKKVCDFLQLNYKDDYFQEIATKKVNANPKQDIPEQVKKLLTRKYQEQEDWLKQRFNLEALEL